MSITKCNLFYHQCNIIIPKGYYRCKTCNGLGVRFRNPHYKYKFINSHICPICKGEGYIDWIQNTRVYNVDEELKQMVINYINSRYSVHYWIHIPFKCPTDHKCKVIKKLVKQHNRKKKWGRLGFDRDEEV